MIFFSVLTAFTPMGLGSYKEFTPLEIIAPQPPVTD
jgi:hypothetical protein